jgi:hypothetical protein
VRNTATVFILVLLTAVLPSFGSAAVIDFESLSDEDAVTTQFPGVVFSNATVLTAGISLNEFEFPPYSGNNVVSDTVGPLSVSFSSLVQTFTAYFTYTTPITLRAYDTSNALLASVTSLFTHNEALSGVSGSTPNEPLRLDHSAGISMITITGSPSGASFVLDDVNISAVPEPNTFILTLIPGLIAVLAAYGRRAKRVTHHFLIVLACMLTVSMHLSAAVPTITVNITPHVITANTQTAITATVQITDPSLIPGSVTLVRQDGTQAPVVLGVLHDDGSVGDLIAGDDIYTIESSTWPTAPGSFDLFVSAAFRGVLQRVKSTPVHITVQSQPVNHFLLFTNANDPLLLQGTAPTGETVQYFGTKDSSGFATSVTGFLVRDSASNVTRYTLDASGRPTQILAANGSLFKLKWNPGRTVTVTGIAPDNSVQTTITVPVSSSPVNSSKALGRSELRTRTTPADNIAAADASPFFVSIDLTKCALPLEGANVWVTVAHPSTGAFFDAYQALDVNNGKYIASLPRPDPHAGQNAGEKCSAVTRALGKGCEALEASPLLPVAVCGTLAAAGPVSPAVVSVCAAAFGLLGLYCETLGRAQGSDSLESLVCPLIERGVDNYVNAPVDLTIKVNGQTADSRYGVSLSGTPQFFTIPLACTSVTLQVQKLGSGSTNSTITASPSAINCGSRCSDSFTPPFQVQVTAIPGANATFSSWAGECSGTATSTTISIPPDAASLLSCSGTFDSTLRPPITTLTITKTGTGTVISTPAGITCGSGCTTSSAPFPPNSPVQLNATFASGTVVTWGGDCAAAGNSATATVTVNGSKSCTVSFDEINQMVQLTIQSYCGVGRIVSAPAGINCYDPRFSTCTAKFPLGSVVQLSETPFSPTSPVVPNGTAVWQSYSCTTGAPIGSATGRTVPATMNQDKCVFVYEPGVSCI